MAPHKPVLCYTCALRMSTIPLTAVFPVERGHDASTHMRLTVIPPPSVFNEEVSRHLRKAAALNEVRRREDNTIDSLRCTAGARVIITNYHPLFDIVYEVDQVSIVKCDETDEIVKKNVSQHFWDLMKKPPTFGTSKVGHTYRLTDGVAALLLPFGSYDDIRLCMACRGLYQFLDSFIAHATGEAVRRSPYFDSTKISVNTNVPRCISFLWLAVATVFLKGAVLTNKTENEYKHIDSLTGMFPEEYASFKDLYTPDVRARVMAKVSEAEDSSKETNSDECHKRSRTFTDTPNDLQMEEKWTKERCTQGFSYCHNSEGIILDIDVRLPIFEPLTGEGYFEHNMKLLAETEMYREHVIKNTENRAETTDSNRGNCGNNKWVSRKRQGRNNQKSIHDDECDVGINGSIFPKEWCTNKSLSLGCPLPLSIIEYYMFDYLESCDPLWQQHFGIINSDMDVNGCDVVVGCHIGNCSSDLDDKQTEGDEKRNIKGRKLVLKGLSSLDGKNYITEHLLLSDTQESVLKKCPLEIHVNMPSPYINTEINTQTFSFLDVAASVMVTVRHANLYLIGKYCKYSRGMSQSPWFVDGKRIGGDTNSLSLQECVVSPMLPLFFPRNGVPSSIPPPGTHAAKEINREHISSQFQGNLHNNNPSTSHCESSITANSVDEPISEKKDHIRMKKTLYNGPRGTTTATSVDKETAEIEEGTKKMKSWTPGVQTKYAGTPLNGADPVRMALDEVEGYGHYKFHTAGREDVDVRMLGTGRPFVIEMISPERELFSQKDLRELEVIVNDDTKANKGGNVIISDLRLTNADITVTLSKHSVEKRKVYRCVVYSSRAIVSDSDPLLLAACSNVDLEISQLTPLRVLHRRSLLNRRKIIHSIKIERTNSHWFVCTLETQAGTYVKEFVHGDMGRTVPNIGTLLGTRADIIQLDVLGMSDIHGLGGESVGYGENGHDGDNDGSLVYT